MHVKIPDALKLKHKYVRSADEFQEGSHKERAVVSTVEFGSGGYQDAMFGLSFYFQNKLSGCGDFIGLFATTEPNPKLALSDHIVLHGQVFIVIQQIFHDAGAKTLQDLINKPVELFEPWVSRFFSGFYSPEESPKSFIQTSQGCLGTRKIDSREPRIYFSFGRKPRRLFRIPNSPLFCFVGFLSLGETLIPEPSMRLCHDPQFTILVPVSPETVFEGFNHLLALNSSIQRGSACFNQRRDFGFHHNQLRRQD